MIQFKNIRIYTIKLNCLRGSKHKDQYYLHFMVAVDTVEQIDDARAGQIQCAVHLLVYVTWHESCRIQSLSEINSQVKNILP